jgi:hypothetical protein
MWQTKSIVGGNRGQKKWALESQRQGFGLTLSFKVSHFGELDDPGFLIYLLNEYDNFPAPF